MSAIFLSPKIAHIAKYGLHEEDHTPNGKCEAKGGDDCLVFVRDGGIILIRGEARGEGPVAEGLKSVEKIGGRVDDAEEARFGDHEYYYFASMSSLYVAVHNFLLLL